MLVLSRKILEEIVLIIDGKEVVITVVRVKNSGCVSIGIEAPEEVRIIRRELLYEGKKQ